MNLMGINIPTSKLEVFIRSVDISSYLPGRIRLYLKELTQKPGAERDVREYLGKFTELKSVEINSVTGSILIKYEPEVLRQNPDLRQVEEYIRTHARRNG